MFRREERDLLRCSLLSFHALAPYFAWNVFDVATSCRSNSTCRRVSRNFHTQHKETRHAQPVLQVFSGTAATSRSLPPGPRAGPLPAAPSRQGCAVTPPRSRIFHWGSQLNEMVDRLQVACCESAVPSDAVVRSCMQPLQSPDGDHRQCRCLPCALPSRSTFRRAAAHVVAR